MALKGHRGWHRGQMLLQSKTKGYQCCRCVSLNCTNLGLVDDRYLKQGLQLQRLFSLSINLPIIFTVCSGDKMSKFVNNSHHNFPKTKMVPPKCFFCPTSSPSPKDSSFTDINDSEKQQIFTLRTKTVNFHK